MHRENPVRSDAVVYLLWLLNLTLTAGEGPGLLFAVPLSVVREPPAVCWPRPACIVRSCPALAVPALSPWSAGRKRAGGAAIKMQGGRADGVISAGEGGEGVGQGKDDAPLPLGNQMTRPSMPWVARSESRRITANLMEMLRVEPARARAYFDALCLERKADSFHYSVMMDACPDIAGAQALLNQMRSEGLVPQTTSFNVLLKKLCLEGNMDAAEDLLLEMESGGIPPDERSYTQLVCGYSDLGNTELAQHVFERMQEAGFVRHLQCWEELVAHLQIKRNTASLASMLSKGADYRTQAERFYQGLVASNATDVVLFNIMLNASRTVDEARAVWHDMEHVANLTPSTASYNTMLRVLCEADRIDEAMQLLGEAEALGLADERSYTRIISVLHQRGRVADATQVFARCQDRMSLTQDADAPVLNASVTSGAPGDGSGSRGAGPEAHAVAVEPPYMALVRRVASAEKNKELHRLIQAGMWDEAWALFQSWARVGEADTFAFNTIMHGCGSASAALSLKADMEAANVPLSLATWNIVVQLLAIEGMIDEGCQMLDEMEDRGITPTERTLRPLLKAMSAQGQGRNARRIQQRCKLQRQVREKELALREAHRVVGAQAGAEDMTEAERKDAAAALVAAAIVEQQASKRKTPRSSPATALSLPPPPGGWSQFRDRDGTVVSWGGRRDGRRGADRGRAEARGRGGRDGSWRGARSIRQQRGEDRPGSGGGGAEPP